MNQPESLTVACGTSLHAECLESGCGPCEVCGADMSCYFSDCHCGVDGLCHGLCATDSDCNGDDRCIVSLWSYSGSDLVGFPLSICWSGPEDEMYMWLI